MQCRRQWSALTWKYKVTVIRDHFDYYDWLPNSSISVLLNVLIKLSKPNRIKCNHWPLTTFSIFFFVPPIFYTLTIPFNWSCYPENVIVNKLKVIPPFAQWHFVVNLRVEALYFSTNHSSPSTGIRSSYASQHSQLGQDLRSAMSPDRHIAPIYEERAFQGPLYRSPSHNQQGTLYRSTSGWFHVVYMLKKRRVKKPWKDSDKPHTNGSLWLCNTLLQ